eukprot:CAMPEP_0113293232 /NCGR_PEP_ID=MMETSP0008_2-20120614/35210_1 /TAXON_ID=97485 /ORGANISM="Prymnesium parvum" /LENGTH=260 /DNA_ID=CAMNT_0000145673 /DNA_START=179 /DNA_END=959 /DNA_ORIENTATION=+ /assembly_acc=CAM_ASM_000153
MELDTQRTAQQLFELQLSPSRLSIAVEPDVASGRGGERQRKQPCKGRRDPAPLARLPPLQRVHAACRLVIVVIELRELLEVDLTHKAQAVALSLHAVVSFIAFAPEVRPGPACAVAIRPNARAVAIRPICAYNPNAIARVVGLARAPRVGEVRRLLQRAEPRPQPLALVELVAQPDPVVPAVLSRAHAQEVDLCLRGWARERSFEALAQLGGGGLRRGALAECVAGASVRLEAARALVRHTVPRAREKERGAHGGGEGHH